MIKIFDKFLPFGQYFYLDVRDNLEGFKKIIKNFLVVRLEKSIDSEKFFFINVLDLLDLYIPPMNALIVVKVISQDGEERFSLEVSNYPQEVFLVHENNVGIFASTNEKMIVEFYALDDNLLLESIRKFKNLYKEKGPINAIEDMNNEIKNLVNNIGYELTSPGVNIERTEMAKKFIQLLETLIIEEEVV
jgi:hypothetical protein